MGHTKSDKELLEGLIRNSEETNRQISHLCDEIRSVVVEVTKSTVKLEAVENEVAELREKESIQSKSIAVLEKDVEHAQQLAKIASEANRERIEKNKTFSESRLSLVITTLILISTLFAILNGWHKLDDNLNTPNEVINEP